jgi:hypothetical protein
MTREQRIKYTWENKAEIIDLKKSTIKECDPLTFTTKNSTNTTKAESTETGDVIKRTIVGNTYYWLDSHEDVHLSKCFAKSISERGNKALHLHDHIRQVTAKVGTPTKVYEKQISWKDLGVDMEGMTESLMMDSNIEKRRNPSIFEDYKSGEINQHSVGMQYVKVEMAINDPEYKQEKAVWDATYPLLGNKERANDAGFYFVVKEAKLIEISCVLEGSNAITPTLEAKDIEPSKDTHKNEPSKDTQNEIKQFFNPF